MVTESQALKKLDPTTSAGRGHSNVELAKQRHRERIAELRRQLSAQTQAAGLRRRQRQGVKTAASIGYTNAGKSSLMQQLTGCDVHVRDAPFATLATTLRRLHPPSTPPILVADTVGFVRRLPHALVASFRSTLDEVHEAALLVCVADASDEAKAEQVQVTRRAISELGEQDKPCWLVLNKIDRCAPPRREELRREYPEAIQLSAHSAADGVALHKRNVAWFEQQLVTADIVTAIDGVRMEDSQHLRNSVALGGAGRKVRIDVQRDGKAKSLDVTLEENKVGARDSDIRSDAEGVFQGVSVQELKLTQSFISWLPDYQTQVDAFLAGPYAASAVDVKLATWSQQIAPVVEETAGKNAAPSADEWRAGVNQLKATIASSRQHRGLAR